MGDVENTPGRSLYVRLKAGEAGQPAGKWTDAATGDHGDLLDLIGANRRFKTLRETLDEARRFLALPRMEPEVETSHRSPAPQGSPNAARRLFAMSKPIVGTIAQTYLRERGLTDLHQCASLRFHPRCWYRSGEDDPPDQTRDAWPAMIAAITDLRGHLTGVHRTWLDPWGRDKAPISTPRRAIGHLLGNGVRFAAAVDVVAAGEGVETMLSLRQVLPTLPAIAALSANHLAAIKLPPSLRRLYIARDDDPAGLRTVKILTDRAIEAGIEVLILHPAWGDFNDDLQRCGRDGLADRLRVQLAPDDIARFWRPASRALIAGEQVKGEAG